MNIPVSKYHALGNDFLVVEQKRSPGRKPWKLAAQMCARHSGIGADGVVCLSPSRTADYRIDIYNADGGWAEKSGNGLRIAGVWAHKKTRRPEFRFETSSSTDRVWIARRSKIGAVVSAELGVPDFTAASLPVKTKSKAIINGLLKIGSKQIRTTCLSTGNPHVVVLRKDFLFDWRALGAAIEHSPLFPRGTNVEFVRVVNRKRLEVMEWERGVGETGSSGTGAAAAVAAMVMLGLIERTCAVKFPAGVLDIHWRPADNVIELTGPVTLIMNGMYFVR